MHLHSIGGEASYLDAAIESWRTIFAAVERGTRQYGVAFRLSRDRTGRISSDTGIIVLRACVIYGGATDDGEFLMRAREGALSLAFDFARTKCHFQSHRFPTAEA